MHAQLQPQSYMTAVVDLQQPYNYSDCKAAT